MKDSVLINLAITAVFLAFGFGMLSFYFNNPWFFVPAIIFLTGLLICIIKSPIPDNDKGSKVIKK